METKIAIEKIVSAMNEMREKENINPKIYIGKTTDFNFSKERHEEDEYPILLRVAIGTPKQIADLEAKLIERFKDDKTWTINNKNGGSAGNTEANQIYICLDSTSPSDELCEWDEKLFLGYDFPLDLSK